ncbi:MULTISPECIES: GNAT family N-acetyltransferase [unclassified Pseudoalteromonas]|uniref:GNAT family N-acetyltransferase n=1 Tax=unclassified Pseudoalteromonas TaxID=194690 RepID=UPI0030147E95
MNITPSPRLRYRLLNAADLSLLADLDSDPEVMKFINGGHPHSVADIKQTFIPRLTSYVNPEKGWGLWGCFDISSTAFLGWLLVRPMGFFDTTRNDQDIELGWRFKKQTWGKGLATEAAAHIMAHLRAHNPKIEQFSAIAMPNNKASIKVMTKLDMEFVKQGVHHDPLGDLDVVYYTLQVK